MANAYLVISDKILGELGDIEISGALDGPNDPASGAHRLLHRLNANMDAFQKFLAELPPLTLPSETA